METVKDLATRSDRTYGYTQSDPHAREGFNKLFCLYFTGLSSSPSQQHQWPRSRWTHLRTPDSYRAILPASRVSPESWRGIDPHPISISTPYRLCEERHVCETQTAIQVQTRLSGNKCPQSRLLSSQTPVELGNLVLPTSDMPKSVVLVCRLPRATDALSAALSIRTSPTPSVLHLLRPAQLAPLGRPYAVII